MFFSAHRRLARLSPSLLSLISIAAFMVSGNTGRAQDLVKLISNSIDYRIQNFSECRAIIEVVHRHRTGERETKVEVWVKGAKVRNDLILPSGRCHAVVDGASYIARYRPDELPVVGPVSDVSDIWQHLGIIHPASVGAVEKGISIPKQGNLKWIFDRDDAERHLPNAKSTDTAEGKYFEMAFEKVVPNRIDAVQREHLKETGRFLIGPDIESSRMQFNINLTFAGDHEGQLLNYEKIQFTEQTGSRSLVKLRNEYSRDISTGISYVRLSEFSVTHNGDFVESKTTSVSEIDFSPVDDEVFTLDGLGLADGTEVRSLIADKGPVRGKIVEGKAKFPESGPRVPPLARAVSPTPLRFRVLLGVNLVLVAGLLLYYVFRIRSRRNVEK